MGHESTDPVTGIREGDSPEPRSDLDLPLVIVLDRLRSAHNVGNVFRTAEAVRAREIITCGYTATPPHPKLEKTARGCDVLVPSRNLPTAEAAVQELQRAGYHVFAVETVESAVPYHVCVLPFPLALVLGNEALGVSPEALAACDGVICLPALGCKNSINVGNCAAVCMFEALRQWRGENRMEATT